MEIVGGSMEIGFSMVSIKRITLYLPPQQPYFTRITLVEIIWSPALVTFTLFPFYSLPLIMIRPWIFSLVSI